MGSWVDCARAWTVNKQTMAAINKRYIQVSDAREGCIVPQKGVNRVTVSPPVVGTIASLRIRLRREELQWLCPNAVGFQGSDWRRWQSRGTRPKSGRRQ